MNINNQNYLLFLCIGLTFLILACEKDEMKYGFTMAETERLLAGDSTKNWIRVNRKEGGNSVDLKDCEEGSKLHFSRAAEEKLNILFFESSCDDTVFYGNWVVTNSLDLPTADSMLYLFNADTLYNQDDSVYVDYDTVYTLIRKLTSRYLTISKEEIIDNNTVFVEEDFIYQ